MGAWYTIGLCVGVGIGTGVLLSGLLASWRIGVVVAVILAAAAGVGVGYAFFSWPEALGGGIGGVLGALGAAGIVRGTLRRGGTRLGTAVLVGLAGVGLAVLAVIPVVGYLEAVVIPVLAVRLRRRDDGRFAGLRILARD
ncbi:MAG: hypothetical protein ACXVZ3_02775 [Gaiellaceae bacterium]